MKFQKTLLMLTTSLSLSLLAPHLAWSHEGHDHDSPKSVRAPKAGILKSMENIYVEVVSKGKDIKVFIYDKELKPQEVKAYKVSALTEKPKQKKQEKLELTDKGTHFEATYDAQRAHRYTLLLTVKDPQQDHEDVLKFTIEPKK